ncbi:anti-sigma factor [Mucilaginibacter pedocola]|uniref:Anti-sigma K factor RskA C-terminal domain-containing protein n=1 Tax=Mucilaginibacter pedocola TaxID=1792845 RepID=A0A1S9PD96_9SPHI|nr:anti-sigma factor [Mucilaginibacter pedocola]OOQ58921.1 hypothetical protein BC343_08520 [Mucilaginibacter pedocola]
MENIEEYIESGILELYVLGQLSPEEKLQVEEMAAKHTAVRAEITEIEQAMEFYAAAHAVEPAALLEQKINGTLVTNLADDRIFTNGHTRTEEIFEDDELVTDNVVQMNAKSSGFYKYAFAACLALLLVSIYALVNLYNKLQESNTQLTAMQLDKQKIANQVILKDNELDIYRDPSYKVFKLKGTTKSPEALLTLAWSADKQRVVLDMKSMKLPEHDKQHQYQLWAIVGGKPVDLGVFDKPGEADTAGVKEMKSVANAEMFAVTVEPMGGSVNPTLTEMVVAGATK